MVTRDGAWVAALGPDQKIALYPLAGGESRSIPGITEDTLPLGWTDRPGVLFVGPGALSRRTPVSRLDVATGRREAFRDFGPAETIGSPLTLRLQVTADGSRYAYLYFLPTTDLVLIEGVLRKRTP